MFKSYILVIALMVIVSTLTFAQAPTTINDFFLPGSQPLQSGSFTSLPSNCGCHDNYDLAVEPMYTWKGSMMAQSQRDPLYLAALTIANQDAAFSGDLCIRCHSPRGWLSGRSVPTDGSLLTVADREGIYCDFCHRAVKPSQIGVNPYPSNTEYTNSTYPADQTYLSELTLPNNRPLTSGNGMYLIDDADNFRRGPYTESDAQATHQEGYSPFHTDALMCATCHDVSNPAYTKQANGTYVLNSLNAPAPDFNPYEMFPVERTFSEWMMSTYNSPTGVYAPQFGGNKEYVSTCQDCHMRDVTGKGCDKQAAPIRTDLGLHDLTGGNTFIPLLLPGIFGSEVNAAALNAGIVRANYMLQNATTMLFDGEPIRLQDDSIQVKIKITNNTGHKLPSGYPEGRRMWLNIKAYDIDNNLIFESGAYNSATGVLTEGYQIKVYEIKPGLSPATALALGKTPGPSFHFVLNDTIYKDNRIPPQGFTNANFATIQSPPIAYTYNDGQYWDITTYKLHPFTARYTATLYYQTVSKEYIEFLRDFNTTDTRGTTMYNLWNSNGKSAPVVMKTINGTVEDPLPVELSTFAALLVGNSVQLNWNTATEINNYGFDIERRVNNSDWQTIGFVNGNGNSNTPHQYTFTDRQLIGGSQFAYRLKQIDNNGQYEYSYIVEVLALPKSFELDQNFPNPFNPSTKISWQSPVSGWQTLKVYDMLGTEVAKLVDEYKPAGVFEVTFDAAGLASGIYVYRLQAGSFVETKKMVILK